MNEIPGKTPTDAEILAQRLQAEKEADRVFDELGKIDQAEAAKAAPNAAPRDSSREFGPATSPRKDTSRPPL